MVARSLTKNDLSRLGCFWGAKENSSGNVHHDIPHGASFNYQAGLCSHD